jgi:tRNA A58 N-methylase Trm61
LNIIFFLEIGTGSSFLTAIFLPIESNTFQYNYLTI